MVSAAIAPTIAGREFLERLRDGRLPPPPFIALLGLRLETIEDGRVVFTAEPGEHLYNGIGLVHGGFVASLFDSAIGCAITSVMPAGKYAVTLDLQVRYFKPLTAASGTIRCEGTTINVGRTTATGEGRLEDAAGRLCGHATSTCAILKGGL